MSYLSKDKVPENKLPIYFCNANLKVLEIKRKRKYTYTKEVKKIVLKGVNEDDLKKNLLKKKNKFLTKIELKNSEVIECDIEIIRFLSFGIFE